MSTIGRMTDAEPDGTPTTPLAGRTALVTGGGSGIGEACARRLAGMGATVTIADVDAAAAAGALLLTGGLTAAANAGTTAAAPAGVAAVEPAAVPAVDVQPAPETVVAQNRISVGASAEAEHRAIRGSGRT